MTFNSCGELIEPEFHDGFLTGVRMVGKTLNLYLTTIGKENFVLKVPNVLHLKADNFLQGNIVFGVTIYSEIKEEQVLKLHEYSPLQAEIYLPNSMREIANKKLCLIELSSSYGCDLLALFSGQILIEAVSKN